MYVNLKRILFVYRRRVNTGKRENNNFIKQRLYFFMTVEMDFRIAAAPNDNSCFLEHERKKK